MQPPETCDTCQFDGQRYTLDDALGTLRALPTMWRWAVADVDERTLLARPAADVWSAAEYTAHAADVTQAMGRLLHGLLTLDDLEVEAVPEGHAPDVSDGFDAAMGRLEANLSRLHDRAARVGPHEEPAWMRTALADGHEVSGGWVLRHAVHDVSHHLSDVGRGLHALGAGAKAQTGSVVQLNVSDGGVPKAPVPVVEIDPGGVVGDRQGDRRNHGRPLQALCLWSLEVIEALQREGHPIAPGLAGENVTISGVDWPSLRPGVQLRLGEVVAEISAYATPCKKNAAWFADRDVRRINHDLHPGWSRAYAWVRQPGLIRTGDEVVVEP